MYRHPVLVIAATLVALSAQAAEIYRCQVDGQTLFSQTPCAPQAQTLDVKVHTPKEADVTAAQARAAATASEVDGVRQQQKASAETKTKDTKAKETARGGEPGATGSMRRTNPAGAAQRGPAPQGQPRPLE